MLIILGEPLLERNRRRLFVNMTERVTAVIT